MDVSRKNGDEEPLPGNEAENETRSVHLGPPREVAGGSVGPFVLLQKVGEGGMGTVWVAEQTRPVKRRVALKLIRADLRSSETMRRFEAERQALALMDHNNIAKVLDAGETSEGTPYFAMEFIKGIPITKYCDEMRVDMRDRLRLFIQVCDAVQHAHQKGVIHRDLKPSNILVAMQDGVPTPKIIDFGVAKALHQKLSDATMYTEIGQVIGTLEYMSPEQAELSALDVDTRADIYSLGVILYELCTGSTPLTSERIRSAGILGAIRLIKEDEPMRPSTRLSQSTSSLKGVSNSRREDPRRLVAQLRGEVDWIILKTLEKDRTRRYDSAIGLGNDIRRFLNNEPVQARPASTPYLLRKLISRHRAIAIGVACCFGVLLLGVIGTTYGLIAAEYARREAISQREVAIEQKKEAEKQKGLAIEQQGIAVTAKDEAEKQKSLVIEQNERIGSLNKRMRSLLDSFISQSMVEMLSRQTSIDASQKSVLNNILEQYEQIVESDLTGKQSQSETATVYDRIAGMHEKLKNYSASREAYGKSIQIWRELLASAPNSKETKVRLALALMGHGIAQQLENKLTGAESSYRESIALYEGLQEFQNGDAIVLRQYAQMLSNLANNYTIQSKFIQCAEIQKRCVEVIRRIVQLQPENLDFQDALGWALWSSANNLNHLGEYTQAQILGRESVSIFRELVRKSPSTSLYQVNLMRSLSTLGNALYYEQSYDQAEEFYLEVIAKARAIVTKYPGVLEYKSQLCEALTTSGYLALRKGDRMAVESLVHEGVSVVTSIEDGAITDNLQRDMRRLVTKLGELALQSQLYDQAYLLYSRLAKILTGASDEHTNQVWLSYCLVSMDRVDEAKLDLPEFLTIETGNAVVLYTKACVYSLALKKNPGNVAYQQAAERFLNRSIQRGYSDFANMVADPDLESIRNGECYRLWVQDYPRLGKLVQEKSYLDAVDLIKRLEVAATPSFEIYLCLYLSIIAKMESNEELSEYVRTKLETAFPSVRSDFDCDRVLKSGLLVGMDATGKFLEKFASQLDGKLETPTWGAYYAFSNSWANLKRGNAENAIKIARKMYGSENESIRLSKDWITIQAYKSLGNSTEASSIHDRYEQAKKEAQAHHESGNAFDLDWLFFCAMTKE